MADDAFVDYLSGNGPLFESNPRANANNVRTDQYMGSFRFRVWVETIDPSLVNQAWLRVSGVVSTSEEMEFMHGSDPYVRKAPGRATFEPVSLERVYEGTDALYKWRRAIEMGWDPRGGDFRRNVNIELLDRAMQPQRRMVLSNAWPSRWELPELDASGPNAAVERITLTLEEVYEDVV